MKVTFFGTTTLLFDDGKDQILFDCHFTRPSILSYIRGGDPEKAPLPLKYRRNSSWASRTWKNL